MVKKYHEGVLFPDFDSLIVKQDDGRLRNEASGEQTMRDPFKETWCRQLSFSSMYQHPVVKATIIPMQYNILGFHRCKRIQRHTTCPHFYAQDGMIYRVWSRSDETIRLLKLHPCAIGPDLSVHCDMPLPMKETNIFRNKLITAWWQYNGIVVYPNVVWSTGIPYEKCFDGLPKHSVVAVNSTGIGLDMRARYVWREGYEQMLDILNPIHIIRYGAKQDGERSEISTFFDNDNKRSARHGW